MLSRYNVTKCRKTHIKLRRCPDANKQQDSLAACLLCLLTHKIGRDMHNPAHKKATANRFCPVFENT